ncbi:type II toxin-antitoxin system prevent-host-death family antitoxin [Emcibacter sp.]|uniref:type II toxin-antitoxin system Phd/YefM family antitoxin n=1 Tax=Emcibacter sp. TaxID=1979954 RepID=UPI002AA7EC7D|nr:type II toxin-antitoxin system prevent-host-death family antitoxin [Emcibacter sp.]
MKIAIHEAKGKLSGLIKAAGEGEQILLTKHGKPVAEIRPIAGAKTPEEKKAALDNILARAKEKAAKGVPAAEADKFLYDDTGMPG